MSPVELTLAAAMLVVVVAGVWLLFSTRRELEDLRRRDAPAGQLVEMLQRQIEAVRLEGRSTQESLKQDVGELRVEVKDGIGALRLGVASELQGVSAEVTRQLQEGMRLLQSAQSAMGERLDRTTRVVGEVQGSLGKLGEATQRMVEVGRDIQGLEQVLKSPKIRGGLGETLLAELLGQMLPREHYTLQHGFKGGDKVDATILIGGRLVPVDAKFPLENFRRMLAEPEEERRRALRRAFARDVKIRVDEIAKKYILPDEGTLDFALMYVPAENVYYEIVIKDEDGEGESIAAYALGRRVVPVSPNTLYAYLQVIILGLRGLRIEANAREIQNDLIRLGGDLEKVRDHMQKVGGHLANAQKQFVDAERDLDRFESKLEAIERKGEAQPQASRAEMEDGASASEPGRGAAAGSRRGPDGMIRSGPAARCGLSTAPSSGPRIEGVIIWNGVSNPEDTVTDIQFQVYGINLLVRLLNEAPADVRVHCPKGSPIRYGEVVGRGDGFDEGANAFREMPPLRSVVAFEENPEEVEGHYFYIAAEEHRVIRLDAVILSFPLE